MWINVHLFFKPEIKPDLPPNRFFFLVFFNHYYYLITKRERNEERALMRQCGEKETKDNKTVWSCLLLIGKLPEEARQWKWKEQRHTHTHTQKNSRIGCKGRQREASDAPHSCCGLLKWGRRNLSHGDGIRNVNRLSQSRAGTVWKERVSTLTEGHARFWDRHRANGKITGHYVCACVDVSHGGGCGIGLVCCL